jgi:pimeloyl-ACP methyl ester carboxylesterase
MSPGRGLRERGGAGLPRTPRSPVSAPSDLLFVVSADGTGIALEPVGDGPRELLLLPGGPARRDRWARVAARLDGLARCWLVDRRGKGDSGDTAPYTLEREEEDVIAAAARLHERDGRPVVVAGHSSGATVALRAAARGARIDGLVLYEPPWPLEGPLQPSALVDELDALVEAGDREGALIRALTDVVGVAGPVVEQMRGLPTWADRVAHVHTWPREMRALDALPRDLAHLTRMDVPTLLLTGEHSPRLLGNVVHALAAVLPDAHVAVLTGQGHGALDTAPEAVAAVVEAFVTPAGRTASVAPGGSSPSA